MAVNGKNRLSLTSNDDGDAGVLSRFSRSDSESSIYRQSKRAASNTAFVTNKLLRSTGKAVCIAGTTFLILIVPLIIEMDREQQLNEIDLQQATLLGASTVSVQK
ncbi:hypothetical protein Csa_011788 [Cucumis sativus]|uniref:Uncharacterized protein n=1 Tax=Cucumis sativus TaxID=3659 RepID=A0A0A0L6Z2_CUCSA|nr:hypothetical protein Csa_011788 [Cucumis sativus]